MQSLAEPSKDHCAIISRTIKAFRKKSSFTQQELAKLSGISQGQLSKIEKGEHLPSIESLDLIATALGIPTSLIAYIAFDRNREQDELSKKLFETYDLLLSLWLYTATKKTTSKPSEKNSIEENQSKNKVKLRSFSQDLEILKTQGVNIISGDFIEKYISSTEN